MIDRMSDELAKAMWDALPVETTIIDANDEVVAWNKHETRIFHRPMSSMGLNFRECHPAESLDKVVQIVEDMRSGKSDTVRFWIDFAVKQGEPKHKILIEFYALRDAHGVYLGCLEAAQDVQDIIGLSGQKRLAD